MLVGVQIAVEPFCVAGALNNKGGINFTQGSQGSVDGVEGYGGKNLFYPSKNRFCRRMFGGFNERPVNSQALSCHLQACITTPFLEIVYFLFLPGFFPVVTTV
jgi:hypothetical protein